MATIRHTLQKEVFDITEEKLVGLLHVTKPGKKKKKISFLCAAINKEKPVYAFIHQVKETDKDSFKKKNSWPLFELQIVDGKDETKETAELDLTIDRIYKWVASSVPEKHFFIQVLWELCCRYLPKQKPLFINVPGDLIREDSDKNEGKVVIASGEPCINPCIDSYHSNSNSGITKLCSNAEEVTIVGDFKENKETEEIIKSAHCISDDKLDLYNEIGCCNDETESDNSESVCIDESSQDGRPRLGFFTSVVKSSSNESNNFPKEQKEPDSQSVVVEEGTISNKGSEVSCKHSVNEGRTNIKREQETKHHSTSIEIVDIDPLSLTEMECDIFPINTTSRNSSKGKNSCVNEGGSISIISCDKWDDTGLHVQVHGLQEMEEVKMQSNSCFGYSNQLATVNNEGYWDDEWEEEDWDCEFEQQNTDLVDIEVPMESGAEGFSWNLMTSMKTTNDIAFHDKCHIYGKNRTEAIGTSDARKGNKPSTHNVQYSNCSINKEWGKTVEFNQKRELACKWDYDGACGQMVESNPKPRSGCCYRCGIGGDMGTPTRSNQKAKLEDTCGFEDEWGRTESTRRRNISHCNACSCGFQTVEIVESRQKTKCSSWSIDEDLKAVHSSQKEKCYCNAWGIDDERGKIVEYNKNAKWDDCEIDDQKRNVESSKKAESLVTTGLNVDECCGGADSHKRIASAGATCSPLSSDVDNLEGAEGCSGCHSLGRLSAQQNAPGKHLWNKESATSCKKGFPLSCFVRAITPDWDDVEEKVPRKERHYAMLPDKLTKERFIDYTVEEDWDEMPFEPGYFNEYEADWDGETDDLYYDWDEGYEWGEENHIHYFEENPPPPPHEEEEWEMLQLLMEEDILEIRSRWILSRRYG